MNTQVDTTSSVGDVITSAAGWVAGLSILTMALFPLAIPGVVFILALVLPLAVPAVALALLGAMAAAPVLAVRALRRRAAG